MKKILLLVMIAMMCSITISAQKKQVRKIHKTAKVIKIKSASHKKQVNFEYVSGSYYRIDNNSSDNYYIFKCPGESASILYNKVINAVKLMYPFPEKILEKEKNKSITVNGAEKYTYRDDSENKDIDCYVKYRYHFEFKNGRMKVDAPIIINSFDEKTLEDKTERFINPLNEEENKVTSAIVYYLNDLLFEMDHNQSKNNW